MKFLVQKSFGKLVPLYNSDAEKLKAAKLKEGETYEVEIKRKRNYQFHKKFFALLNLAYDNQEMFEDFDDLRPYLIIKAGYYKRIKTDKGEFVRADSISFAKMEQAEFEQLYSKMIDAVIKFLDTSKDDLLAEIVSYM